MGANWEALKLEFVNGTMTYRELAETHGVKPGTMKKRGERGNWTEERRQLSRDVAETAQATLRHKRVEALEEINEADLALAQHMRILILQRLAPDATPPLSAAELRSLAGAAVLAQKISRLAIGAATMQHAQVYSGQSDSLITTMSGTFTLTDAQRLVADEILNAYIYGKQTLSE